MYLRPRSQLDEVPPVDLGLLSQQAVGEATRQRRGLRRHRQWGLRWQQVSHRAHRHREHVRYIGAGHESLPQRIRPTQEEQAAAGCHVVAHCAPGVQAQEADVQVCQDDLVVWRQFLDALREALHYIIVPQPHVLDARAAAPCLGQSVCVPAEALDDQDIQTRGAADLHRRGRGWARVERGIGVGLKLFDQDVVHQEARARRIEGSCGVAAEVDIGALL